MSVRTMLTIAIIIAFLAAVSGCSSVPINDAAKQDQLILQVDESVLTPVDRLITLQQYKESQDANQTTNRRRPTGSNPRSDQ